VFAHRCEHATEQCKSTPPNVATSNARIVACWLYDDANPDAKQS
jgi:hypothetical protein